jgi:putative thiamine transport system permease protein
VLGPAQPPTLAVQVLRWFSDPDLAMWFPASAGAVLLLVIVVGATGLLHLAATVLGWALRRGVRSGARGGQGRLADVMAASAGIGMTGTSAAALTGLVLWSVAGVWRFPDAWPSDLGLATWKSQAPDLAGLAWTSLWLAAVATAIALVIAVGFLERERRLGRMPRWTTALLAAPLLVPQIAFLFGMQVALVRLRLDGTGLAVVWAHLVFVLPYVFLALADPWRALDPRLLRTAACLGASPWRVLMRVKLPLLLRPLLAASASGFAVSSGLYLPTLFAGAGRWTTLTTEAVTLSSGADRRILAATAVLQAALPLCVFAVSVAWPSWRERRRRALAIAT